MILYAGEEDPHSICPVVQMGDTGSVQVTGQLIDVCLQLGKGWERRKTRKRDWLEGILEHMQHKNETVLSSPRTKYVNPSHLHGVYYCYEEADS